MSSIQWKELSIPPVLSRHFSDQLRHWLEI